MIVGFAGAGNMAAAIARGWAAGPGGPDAMSFYDIDGDKAHALATEVGGVVAPRLDELAASSDVLLLAVKPAALEEVAGRLGGKAPPLLSVIAATPLALLAEAFPGVPTLRVMPNQPVEVRRGVICHPPPVGMDEALAGSLLDLLAVVGVVVELDEALIDAAMAVMSCSPAYVARFARGLAAPGEREGLTPDLSLRLVTETIAGTAQLLSRRDPEAIERAVAPPGGATEAGLEALEEGGFTNSLGAAVDASLERFR